MLQAPLRHSFTRGLLLVKQLVRSDSSYRNQKNRAKRPWSEGRILTDHVRPNLSMKDRREAPCCVALIISAVRTQHVWP
jgi:hypothetical protein